LIVETAFTSERIAVVPTTAFTEHETVTVEVAKIAKPTGSKPVKGPAESEKFVRWKSMKNSEENS
jgi:hypothetical protein